MSLRHKGFTLWFTGLSGAGKSTLAAMVAARLRAGGAKVEELDGDVVRTHLSKGLGFSKEDRDENVRRIGFVCELLSRHGVIAIASAISPFRAVREEVRGRIGNFVEVYVECPIERLAERDVKGLYKRALAGEIPEFTGITSPYEAPERAEATVNSATETAEESAGRIWETLVGMGLIWPTGAMPPGKLLTPEEYLASEREAEFRHEYYDGEILEREGANQNHCLITGNLSGELHSCLGSRKGQFFGSQMRVQATPRHFFYPDGGALCGEAEFLDGETDTLLNPSFIVEVLSPTTELNDRGRKFHLYRKMASLREYLLLASDLVYAELFKRQEDGRWQFRSYGELGDALTIESIGCELKLADLYAKVEFPTKNFLGLSAIIGKR